MKPLARVRFGGLAPILGAVIACAQAPYPLSDARNRQPNPGVFTREVEARVHYGFPGVWHWELAYRSPDQFRISISTTGASHHYVFDGSVLSTWLGDTRLSRDGRDATAYASIARWLGVTSLAELPARPASWANEERNSLGEGVTRALAFHFEDTGERYVLGFDDAGRVIAARGPIEIPGIGAGRLRARFGDFRSIAGVDVPFSASYFLNDSAFFDERTTRFVSGDATLHPKPH